MGCYGYKGVCASLVLKKSICDIRVWTTYGVRGNSSVLVFTHLCTTKKRALNILTQAFRLLIVSVVFSYYCIVLM